MKANNGPIFMFIIFRHSDKKVIFHF